MVAGKQICHNSVNFCHKFFAIFFRSIDNSQKRGCSGHAWALGGGGLQSRRKDPAGGERAQPDRRATQSVFFLRSSNLPKKIPQEGRAREILDRNDLTLPVLTSGLVMPVSTFGHIRLWPRFCCVSLSPSQFRHESQRYLRKLKWAGSQEAVTFPWLSAHSILKRIGGDTFMVVPFAQMSRASSNFVWTFQ
jgi:hypothetical protein